MTRGAISCAGTLFITPLPIRRHVPGLYLDDPLYLSLCAALDDLLAPAVVALDCFNAYLDPSLTPEDFLPWLGSLVGADHGAGSAAIRAAVASYGDRGTLEGIRAVAALTAEVPIDQVTIHDPGGVTWSVTPVSVPEPVPVSGLRPKASIQDGAVIVKVQLSAEVSTADPAAVSAAVVAALKPSWPIHCALRVEVVSS